MKELDECERLISPVVTSNVTIDSNLYAQACKIKEDYKILSSKIVQLEASLGDIRDEVETVEKLVSKLNMYHPDFEETTSSIVDKVTEIHNLKALNEQLGNLRHERACIMQIIHTFCSGERSLCALCFDREFSMFFMPCGHTACVECTSSIRNGSCPFCRAEIYHKRNIFIE